MSTETSPCHAAGVREDVVDPAAAERVVTSGDADLVGLGRQSLADPEFPNKVREEAPARAPSCLAAKSIG